MGMKLHPTHWFPAEGDGACAGCGVSWVGDQRVTARPCRTPHPRIAEWAAYGDTATASVDGDTLPEGERAAFAGLLFDGPAPIPPGTEVAASAVQERMFAAGWSGTAGHELGRLARRGLARRVRPGVWAALAAWAPQPEWRPIRDGGEEDLPGWELAADPLYYAEQMDGDSFSAWHGDQPIGEPGTYGTLAEAQAAAENHRRESGE